ncbi:hypothetical protein GCM10011374_30230 [Kocuria dechangensis]|uniref:HIRAN domain-containing protein n=1 Tax=Kocuria dechangensis TaxID=1176249 RepID=A0A917LXN2_9MICC|nr:HIRAN domain-containing protein [Kocuria dechangensis]GGG64541.1 hypothetical protein GCM10011374_30230 [Kocuria dechangensis]
MKNLLAALLRPTPASEPDAAEVAALLGREDVEVSGEHYYGDALGRAMTSRGAALGGVRNVVTELIRELRNDHDRNAVVVRLDGAKVGYVPADTARRLGPAMDKAGYAKRPLAVPARLWARRDAGEWSARVTLSPTGAREEEWNYVEQLDVDPRRPATVGERLTDAARYRQYQAAEQAGLVHGQQIKDHQPTVVEHRLAQRWAEGIGLALECRAAAERVAAIYGMRPDAWPTEELARLHRGKGDAAGEVQALEHYMASCGHDQPTSALTKRLEVARRRREAPAAPPKQPARKPAAPTTAPTPSPHITDAVLQDLARPTPDRTQGRVRGRHYTEWVEQVQQFKRDGQNENALALLLECVAATLHDEDLSGAAPWYTEQAAIVLRKLGDLDGEIKILEHHLSHDPHPRPKLRERLAKARARS